MKYSPFNIIGSYLVACSSKPIDWKITFQELCWQNVYFIRTFYDLIRFVRKVEIPNYSTLVFLNPEDPSFENIIDWNLISRTEWEYNFPIANGEIGYLPAERKQIFILNENEMMPEELKNSNLPYLYVKE